MEFQIARAGQVIGTLTPEEIEHNIAQGLLNPDDQFWREGMVEWKPLANLSFYLPKLEQSQSPSAPVGSRILVTDVGHRTRDVERLKKWGFWMIAAGIVMAVIAGSMNPEAAGGAPGGGEIVWGMLGVVLFLLGFIFFIAARMKQ